MAAVWYLEPFDIRDQNFIKFGKIIKARIILRKVVNSYFEVNKPECESQVNFLARFRIPVDE